MSNASPQYDKAAASKANVLLNDFLDPWKRAIIGITALKFTAFVLVNIQLILIAGLISGMALHNLSIHDFYAGLVCIALAGAGRPLMNYFSNCQSAGLTEKITVTLRSDLFEEIQRGYLPVHQDKSPAGITLGLLNKTEVIAPYFTRYIPQMILCIMMPLAVLVYLMTINWVCALLILVMSPAIPIFMIIIGRGSEEKSREQWDSLAQMGGYFMDRLQGITTLYLFNQLGKQSEQVKYFAKSYGDQVLKVLKIAFLSSAVLEFLSAIIIAGCAIFIGLNMIHYINYGPQGGASLRSGLIILLLIPEYFIAFKTLGNYYHDRGHALGAVISLQEAGFFNTIPDIGKQAPGEELRDKIFTPNGKPAGEEDIFLPLPLIFKNVDFAYSEKKQLFKNFSLVVGPCDKVRITGPNGSGKSTLVALLLGWQKPRGGIILLGKQRIESLSEAELFREISVINQQTSIFQGTIRSNILMGASLPDTELWEDVIIPAGLHMLLEKLPMGLDTYLAEDGKSISGGERQKIALARALVRKSRIIILDEPLTHLDPASAENFAIMISKVGHHKTIVVTGHGEAYGAFEEYREIKLTAYAD